MRIGPPSCCVAEAPARRLIRGTCSYNCTTGPMIFLVIITPILFVMVVWVGVTVYRILVPDEPHNVHLDPGCFDFPDDPVRELVLFGARSIRDQGRLVHRVQSLSSPYDYLDGHSDGFPEAWWKDVVQRRN